jgi:uncharacterized protein YegL
MVATNSDETTWKTGGRVGKYAASIIALGAALVMWSSTAAAWDFDQSCGAESQTRNFELMQAQAYIMLDESGSMGWGGKWDDATTAIKRAVDAKTDPSGQDVVQFGLGWFSNGASDRVSPRENAYPDIRDELNSNYPWGGTYMANGIRTSKNTLQDEPDSDERPQATIFVTDGYPSDDEEGIINETCEHREQVGRVYAVGFGSGTDEDFNDMIAAAGGTGTCTDGSGDVVDPCADNTDPVDGYDINDDWDCSGAAQVSGGTGLKSVVSGISNKLACEIDVANNDLWKTYWGDDPYGCSTDDYSCLEISYGPTQTLDYNPDDPNGEGWQWRDENRQETIVLNEQTCNEIEKEYTTNSVDIDRACMCGQQSPGSRCTHEDAKTCECTTGTVQCNQSRSQCEPDTRCDVSDRKGYENSCNVGVGACKNEGITYCSSSGSDQCGTRQGGQSTTVGEAGVKGGLFDNAWKGVGIESRNFDEKPAVLATTQTTAGGQDPSEAHISRVNRGGFYTQHCEVDIWGGGARCDNHNTEKNAWAAIDPSKADGVSGIEAGVFRLRGGTERHEWIDFGTTFSSRPYVFATAQTQKGNGVPRNTQIIDVRRDEAKLEFCEQQYLDSCDSHNAEDIGWFAIDPNASSLGNIEMGEFTTSDSEWKRISFDSAFAREPAVIADVQTEGGSQEALYPEVQNVTNTGADIRFCEYDDDNECDGHATERVAWVAFGQGEVATKKSSNFTTIDPNRGAASTEVCNGIDDDCDGQADEGASVACDTGKPGRCSKGRRECKSDGTLGACKQVRQPVPEICNGLDDDCNGQVDDISESWSKDWEADIDDLDSSDRARACGISGACVCPSADDADDKYRAPASSPNVSQDREFDYMVENTETTCYCTE